MGVVGLQIELEVLQEVELPQEVKACCCVGVVLVLSWFFGFRFDIELATETDFVGVVDRHVQESSEVLLLAFQVGVPQALIALSATPEGVALAT